MFTTCLLFYTDSYDYSQVLFISTPFTTFGPSSTDITMLSFLLKFKTVNSICICELCKLTVLSSAILNVCLMSSDYFFATHTNP